MNIRIHFFSVFALVCVHGLAGVSAQNDFRYAQQMRTHSLPKKPSSPTVPASTTETVVAFSGLAISGVSMSTSRLATDDDQARNRKKISGVEIVYSDQYAINLMGLELLHPFDIHKYKKIVNKLGRDGVLEKNAFTSPRKLRKKRFCWFIRQSFWIHWMTTRRYCDIWKPTFYVRCRRRSLGPESSSPFVTRRAARCWQQIWRGKRNA